MLRVWHACACGIATKFSSLKYVNGLDVKAVYFTAAPRMAVLSHRKPTSAEISLTICVAQNSDRRNALYKKRHKKLRLDITVRIGNNYKAFL
jgi:hypothetical protein